VRLEAEKTKKEKPDARAISTRSSDMEEWLLVESDIREWSMQKLRGEKENADRTRILPRQHN